MEKKEIYRHLMSHLPLTDLHRSLLKEKRGFDDDTIDKLGFKSCGYDLVKNLKDIPDNMRRSLERENILIPYYSAQNEIIHLRPHKYGFEGEGIQVYIPHALLPQDIKTLVVAESEFKAAASCVMGIPAVGIPGIASFSKKRFEELRDKLSALGADNIVICFDHEIKNNPDFPNYKSDFTKRYDTQFYAFVIALQLNKTIPTKIATLSDHWMENGKVDIDGVLAQKIPFSLYHNTIKSALSIYDYKKTWKLPSAHLSFLERKIDRFFYKGPINEQDNCYFVQDKEKLIKISNFIIRIMHTTSGDTGAERKCYFISNYGNSKPFVLTPEIMSSRMNFLRVCYEQGDYEFSGNDMHLQKIWSYLFMHQDGRLIEKIDHYGYNEKLKTWFFSNGAYKDNAFFEVDEEGVVWIDDIGYQMKEYRENESTLPPPSLISENPGFTLHDIHSKMTTKMGKNYANLILGWSIGNFFLPEILKKYKTYPFLFLHGIMAAGKSTISNWVSSFFGFEQKGFPMSGSTAVGIQRSSTMMSMIPIWLEEYRNKDPDIAKKNSYLRSVYDKSTIVKGTKRDGEIKTYTARSTLIISGEEHPRDAALNSRCILYSVSSVETKENQEAYEWLQAHKSMFNYFGHEILMQKKTLWPKIEEQIDAFLAAFAEAGKKIRHRTMNHHAIIAGVCSALLNNSKDFDIFIGEITEQADFKRGQEMALNVFWEDIADLHGTQQIIFPFLKLEESEMEAVGRTREILLWFSGLYTTWEYKFKNVRTDLPASKSALLDHIKNEPYYLGRRNARMSNGETKNCLVLDYNNPHLPDTLRNVINNEEKKKRKQQQSFMQHEDK